MLKIRGLPIAASVSGMSKVSDKISSLSYINVFKNTIDCYANKLTLLFVKRVFDSAEFSKELFPSIAVTFRDCHRKNNDIEYRDKTN